MREKVKELDVYSGIAIIFVVLIHSNAYNLLKVLHLKSYIEGPAYMRLVDNLIHASVPMFIFISGYKFALNDKNKGYINLISKKIRFIIKPFLVLSTTYILLNFMFKRNDVNLYVVLNQFLDIFKGYNIAFQLWYVPLYIFISMTYPIIYKCISNDLFRLMIIIIFIGIWYNWAVLTGNLDTRPYNFIYYIIYYEMGVIFCENDLKYKNKNWGILTIFLFIICVVILTLNQSYKVYEIGTKFFLWPISVVSYYYISLYLKNNKILNFLGKYSFYIFILHEPIIGSCISKFLNGISNKHIMISGFVSAGLTIILSICVYKFIENTFITKIVFYEK